jgi:hypothetical protein
MAVKPKNPQVGVIDCPCHDEPQIVQARVMQSLTKGKYYIACQSCGLIMPTLPNFQEYIKRHARFNQDINSGIIQQPAEKPATSTSEGEQQSAEPEKQSQEKATPAAKAQPEAKPEKVKTFDEEMGF